MEVRAVGEEQMNPTVYRSEERMVLTRVLGTVEEEVRVQIEWRSCGGPPDPDLGRRSDSWERGALDVWQRDEDRGKPRWWIPSEAVRSRDYKPYMPASQEIGPDADPWREYLEAMYETFSTNEYCRKIVRVCFARASYRYGLAAEASMDGTDMDLRDDVERERIEQIVVDVAVDGVRRMSKRLLRRMYEG